MPRGRRPRHHGLPRAAQVVFERAARRGARSRRGGVGSRLGHPRRPRLGRVRQGLRGVVDGLRAAAGARAAGRVVRDQGHARRRHGVVGDLAALRPRALDLTAAAREAGRRLALRLLDARRPLQSAPPRPLPLVRGLRRRLPAADEDGVLPRTPRRAPSHAGALRRAPPRPRQRRHSSRHQTREPAPPRLRRAQGLRLWPRAHRAARARRVAVQAGRAAARAAVAGRRRGEVSGRVLRPEARDQRARRRGEGHGRGARRRRRRRRERRRFDAAVGRVDARAAAAHAPDLHRARRDAVVPRAGARAAAAVRLRGGHVGVRVRRRGVFLRDVQGGLRVPRGPAAALPGSVVLPAVARGGESRWLAPEERPAHVHLPRARDAVAVRNRFARARLQGHEGLFKETPAARAVGFGAFTARRARGRRRLIRFHAQVLTRGPAAARRGAEAPLSGQGRIGRVRRRAVVGAHVLASKRHGRRPRHVADRGRRRVGARRAAQGGPRHVQRAVEARGALPVGTGAARRLAGLRRRAAAAVARVDARETEEEVVAARDALEKVHAAVEQ
mmetsp:Transcript_7845/g.24713  ORF Transcript_7845/g.24713 Transcript_7845/m.24713 type:complete len:558 (+) Transcript_7845:290-1963(+)